MDTTRISSRVIFGIILVAIGVIFLIENLGIVDDLNLFQWIPSIFILLGLAMVVTSRFRSIAGPLIIILVAASVQLAILGALNFSYVWPAIIIALGALILFGAMRPRRKRRETTSIPNFNAGSDHTEESHSGDASVFSIFAENTHSVNSSDFQGGEATAIMGSARMDLRSASIADKPATLEVTCVMGEVKLRIPSEWNVEIQNLTLMGESKDDRPSSPSSGSETDLVVTGTVLLGALTLED